MGAVPAFAQSGQAPRNWLVDIRQADNRAKAAKCGLSTPDMPVSGGMAALVCQVGVKDNALHACDIKDETVPGLGARAVQFINQVPQATAFPLGKPVYANVCLTVAPATPALDSDTHPVPVLPGKFEAPAKAVKAGQDGYASVRCTILASGALSDCNVTAELPTGFGFGDAALKALAARKVKPPLVKGKPVTGATYVEQFYFGLQPFTAP